VRKLLHNYFYLLGKNKQPLYLKLAFNNIVQNISQAFRPDVSRNIESINRQRAAKHFRATIANYIRDAALIVIGVLSAGFGLRGFLIPNGFIDGGVMGISLLTHQNTQLPLSILIILINLPFLLL
jgi:hypothetical protein